MKCLPGLGQDAPTGKPVPSGTEVITLEKVTWWHCFKLARGPTPRLGADTQPDRLDLFPWEPEVESSGKMRLIMRQWGSGWVRRGKGPITSKLALQGRQGHRVQRCGCALRAPGSPSPPWCLTVVISGAPRGAPLSGCTWQPWALTYSQTQSHVCIQFLPCNSPSGLETAAGERHSKSLMYYLGVKDEI